MALLIVVSAFLGACRDGEWLYERGMPGQLETTGAGSSTLNAGGAPVQVTQGGALGFGGSTGTDSETDIDVNAGGAGTSSVEPGSAGRQCPGGQLECREESCCTTINLLGGEYLMGRSTEPGAGDYLEGANGLDDTPEHSVTVAPFALDKYEVTVGRFRQFAQSYSQWRRAGFPRVGDGANPNAAPASSGATGWGQSWSLSDHDLPAVETGLSAMTTDDPKCNWHTKEGSAEEERYPMNCVTWYEAFAFCIWDGGRLPTEAEWEYAAAAGAENRLYPWGREDPDASRANSAIGPSSPQMHVGSFPAGAGAFGHLDLAGSLWEWTFDWHSPLYYESMAAPNACNNCANTEPAESRSLRGGSFADPTPFLRAAARISGTPESSIFMVGFRCARPTR